MSIRVMTLVWEYSIHSAGDLLVLLAIADYANDEGEAFPAVATLARKARMSVRNCQYVLSRLVKAKELEVNRDGGPRGCNLYRVKILHPAAHCRGGVKPIAPPPVKPVAPDPSSGSIKDPSSIPLKKRSARTRKSWTQRDIRATYELYPRLKKPLQAYKAIEKALMILWGGGNENPVGTLQAQTKRFAEVCHQEAKEENYIPYPASWFNGGDWLQEIKKLPCPKCHDPKKERDKGHYWDERAREEAYCKCPAGQELRKKGGLR